MKKHVITSSHWGAGVAEIEDGRLLSVAPHPGDPAPSRINENWRDSLYGKARVRRPAVRESYLENGPHAAKKLRGEERFVEVSWDKALDLVSKELGRIYETHGSGAIYGGSYGWASAGRFHHAQSQLKRFLSAAGGFVRSEGNYSYNAALVLILLRHLRPMSMAAWAARVVFRKHGCDAPSHRCQRIWDVALRPQWGCLWV